MVSDSITAPIPSAPKEFGKKKRAHRSAKLKQCKLDARREQWLSQVGAVKKGGNEEVAAGRGLPQPCGNERRNGLGNLDTRRRGGIGDEEIGNGSVHNDFDSPSNSPTSSVLGGNDSGTNFTASSSSSSSSSSSGGCCSGNITEEEEEGGGDGDDNCLDDWEAVADALAADDDTNNKKQEEQNENLCSDPDSSAPCEPIARLDFNSNNSGYSQENSRQESAKKLMPSRLAPANSRAWRPDDAFRPQCLPNLAKQRSFPNTDRHYGQAGIPWGRVSAATVPSSCPICYEDLDFTDTSFLPCLCGFRLCLFCHKRILEEDGRCPGCRKPYEHEPVEAEPNVHGGSLTFKLARSCSMIARS